MTIDKIVNELQSASEWFTEHGRNTNTAIVGICDKAIEFIKCQNADLACQKMLAMHYKEIADSNAAEIERLNKEVDRLSQCVLYHDGQIVDAIKDFAERLEDTITDRLEESHENPNGETYYITDVYKDIQNVLKEKVGED